MSVRPIRARLGRRRAKDPHAMGVEFIELCLKNLASLAALTWLNLLGQRPPRDYVLEKFFHHVVLVVLEAERPGLDDIQQRGSSDQPFEELERLGDVGGHPATPAGRRACVKFRDLHLEGAGQRQFCGYSHPGAALNALDSSLTQPRNLRELPLRPLALPAQLPNIVSDRLSLRLAHFG